MIEIDNDNNEPRTSPNTSLGQGKRVQAAQPAPPAPVEQPKVSQQPVQSPKSFEGKKMNFNSLFNRSVPGVARTSLSRSMALLIETIDDLTKNESYSGVKFDFIELDADASHLRISALVVVASPTDAGARKVVGYHVLLLAATAKHDYIKQGDFAGVKYDKLMVPGDGYDATMRQIIDERIRAKFPNFEIAAGEASVIPEDMPLDDQGLINGMLSNATIAASSVMLVRQPSHDKFTLAGTDGGTLGVAIKTSYAHFRDLANQPIRSNVVLELNTGNPASQNQNNDNSVYNDPNSSKVIGQVTGYIDLVWNPVQAVSSQLLGQVPGITANYTPRKIITNIDSESTNDLSMLSLLLGTVQSLNENERWIQLLIRQHKDGDIHRTGGVNLSDLGALGLEANQQKPELFPTIAEQARGQRFPTDGAGANDALLNTIVQHYVRTGNSLSVAMDIAENGPNTWLTSVFLAAARGDKLAENEIVSAIDLLTGGNFTPRFKALNGGVMGQLMINDNCFINNGTWLSESGVRDIRDFGYLEILNMTGDSGLDTIRDWSDMQVNQSVDPMFRLAKSRDLLSMLVSSMKITGRSARVTFNQTTLLALAQSIADVGVRFDVQSSTAAPMGSTRHTAGFLNGYSAVAASSGAFAYGGGVGRQGANTNVMNSAGRWGFQGNNF